MNTEKQKLRIGWASDDITPDRNVFLLGQFHVRISEYVKSPITATAMAIESEDGGEQLIMVSLDLVWAPEPLLDSVRGKLEKSLPDFDRNKLFLNATHTHTAPEMVKRPDWPYDFCPLPDGLMGCEEYFEFLSGKVAKIARQAWNERKAGAFSYGLGSAVVGFNRRPSYYDGSSRMYGKTDTSDFSHIEGYEDHGLDLLFTYDETQKLSGILINAPCPSQVEEHEYFISADYWHEVRAEIRKRHGNVFIMPQCSAAGDISPHPILKQRPLARMCQLADLPSEDKRGTSMRIIARRIADAVDEVMVLAAKDMRQSAEFIHKVTTLELPCRQISAEDAEFCRQEVEKNKAIVDSMTPDIHDKKFTSAFRRTGYYQSVVDRYHNQQRNQTLPMESHLIRLGDIAFATNRFELFIDFGEQIKERSKAVQTFVVQLAGQGTYLPTRRAVEAKSYGAGAESNLVGPEGGKVLVDEQVKIINSMFGDE